MRYDLRAMTLRARNIRRREIVFRPIIMPATLAGDLYRTGYSDIITAWSTSVAPIMRAYEQSLAELVQDSPSDMGAVLSSVETDLTTVFLTVRARLQRWAERIEAFHRRKWRGAVLTATTVDIEQLVGAGDMRMPLSAAIERNVGLIRSVSDETRTRIGEKVFQGYQRRAPAREVAAEIREAVGMGRRRALNIASDQTVKIGAALNDERRREAGLSAWAWMSSHKTHFRPEHAARDGKRYDDDATEGAHKPPADRPGELPYCGCTSRAVLSLDGEF